MARPGAAAAGEGARIVAVLSSDAKPYWEAFESFRREVGVPVTLLQLREGAVQLPADAAVVAAFGGRAAQQPYPSGVRLIYCLAPGKTVSRGSYELPPVKIQMTGDPDALVSRLLELQPRLKRLAVFWSQGENEHKHKELRLSSRDRFEVVSVRVRSSEELYEALRGLKGRVDALWMTPDPALVNADNFEALREYSWANAVPFYSPTEGLVEKGASASISASYAEIGRAAAGAARDALAGLPVAEDIHPEKVSVTFSASAAKRAGLAPPVETLKRVESLLP